MKTKKEITIEIDCDDVIDFLDQADGYDVQRIHDKAIQEGADPKEPDYNDLDIEEIETYNQCAKIQGYPSIETLADEMKMEFIASVWDKFTLEQLEEKLK